MCSLLTGNILQSVEEGEFQASFARAGKCCHGSLCREDYQWKDVRQQQRGVAPAFRVRDLIPGWIIALQKMHPGDKWEVYIPAEQAYGKLNQPGIPGGSTLIFEIELISVA